MKKLVLLIVLFWLLVAAQSEIAKAQEQKLSSSPQAFQTFYAKFRLAMLKGDKETVASLTQFPFKYGLDAGNEGTLSKTQFIKRFDEFFKGYKKFFAQKNPVLFSEGANYTLTTDDATHFGFEKKKSSYKFTAMISEP